MKKWLEAIGTGSRSYRDLSYDEAVAAAHAIARGEATDAQIGAFFAALSQKGEAVQETQAFYDVFRQYTVPFASFSDSLTVSGSSECRRTFAVSLPVALLLAAVGFPQVLTGRDALPGDDEEGTTVKELLETLGVRLEADAQSWERAFRACKAGFLWSERICPPLAGLRRARGEIGFGTIMDTVERALNPVRSLCLLVGVGQRPAMLPYVNLLPKTGLQKACIVHGMEGSEDVPTSRTTIARIVTAWGDETSVIDPATFGFAGPPLERIGKEEHLRRLQRILQGDESPEVKSEREHVIFNAGLRLFWFDRVGSYEEGFQLARQLYQRQEGLKVLRRWRELTLLREPNPKRRAN